MQMRKGGTPVKILILGTEARYRAYQPDMPFIGRQELVFLDKDSTEDTILAAGGDAEVLFVDAITPVSGALMERMPRLRLVHSEGVAFDRIDLSASRDRGIYVCNNKGCNAGAVAEQAILLMLMLLRRALEGDRAVREGRQMEMKERCMVEGLTELSACKVGLVGFGDIARAAAERLAPFGCELYYYTKHRRTPEEERKYGITYLPLEELAETCDIVSLHCAVTDETRNMVDEDFLARMKPTAYLINTARGDLVDNEALARALTEGRIAGAGPTPICGATRSAWRRGSGRTAWSTACEARRTAKKSRRDETKPAEKTSIFYIGTILEIWRSVTPDETSQRLDRVSVPVCLPAAGRDCRRGGQRHRPGEPGRLCGRAVRRPRGPRRDAGGQ